MWKFFKYCFALVGLVMMILYSWWPGQGESKTY